MATKSLCHLLPAADLARAGQRLRDGKLVSFPTETVYGLGANAMDEVAILKIFEAKMRPLTDPLIVHVPTVDEAFKLVDFSPERGGGGDDARRLFAHLADTFWPGPLASVERRDDLGLPLRSLVRRACCPER